MSKQLNKADRTNKYVLGIDAGGTYFKSVLVDSNNEVLISSQRKQKIKDDKDSILECYTSLIDEGKIMAKKVGGTLVGIGVSSPGPFDYHNTISFMKHKLKSIYGLNLEKTLRSNGVLEDMSFCCMHDGLSFLYGEYIVGSAKGFSNVAALTLGTGTGFSIIKNGELCETSQGSTAFSIYQNPLEGKKVEDYLSSRGIVQMYNTFSKNTLDYTAYDIEKKAIQNDDKAAQKTFNEAGRLIAEATRDILKDNKIECFVLGGQISRAFPLMESSIREGLKSVSSLQKICMGESIDFSAQIGVAHKAFSLIKGD